MSGPTEHDTAATTRPLRRDAQRNRERVIEAAREVFAARGFAATLDDVAHHAGVGVGTVYRRFPTKEALAKAVFTERMDEVIALAEQDLTAESAWDGLTMFLTRSARMHADDRGLRDAVLSLSNHDFAQVEDRIRTLVGRLVERAKAEGTLRVDVDVTDIPIILVMISDIARSCPGAYERYLQVVIDGLRARPDNGDLGTPLTRSCFEAVMAEHVPLIEPRQR